MKYPLEIMWEKKENGAKIHRVYGMNLALELPQEIEGNPLVSIGPYCFSSSERYPKEGCFLTSIGNEENRITEPTMPTICGRYVEEIILPDSVKELGNAAFYNCRNLKMISMGREIESFGSDEFTNCVNLKNIIIRGHSEEKSGLPMILERIKTEVEVEFQAEKGVCEARVFFPEYYEWLDELTPAHTFNRVIVGEGFRMRQCFQDRRLHLDKFDQCFADSVKSEAERDVCRIALNRLRWPLNLKEDFVEIYKKAVEERWDVAFQMVLDQQDFQELEFLCQYFSPTSDQLSRWMELCIKTGWTEGNVYLMEQKHQGQSFAEKTFDFDDFDDW